MPPRPAASAPPESASPPTTRCADSSYARQEPLQASAPRQGRFLLLEVPGPWGRKALTESRLDPTIAAGLAARAEQATTKIILIRRPAARAAAEPATLSWAIADSGTERICWGSYTEDTVESDLLTPDLTAPVPARGPQRVALVCTNARRDQCCAISGRPVAAAIASGTSWDTWECSHLGGHRFAANVLLLPSGELFGRLDPDLAIDALTRFEAGEIMLSHHRGRCGQPPMVQAALHAAALRLGDSRPNALRSTASRHLAADTPADIWEIDVAHRDLPSAEAGYRVTVSGTKPPPAYLSCADPAPKSDLHYQAIAFTRLH